jgi:hypothetical protein
MTQSVLRNDSHPKCGNQKIKMSSEFIGFKHHQEEVSVMAINNYLIIGGTSGIGFKIVEALDDTQNSLTICASWQIP